MMITAKPWNPSYYPQNSCALLEQCHENKKTFESSNLLGTMGSHSTMGYKKINSILSCYCYLSD